VLLGKKLLAVKLLAFLVEEGTFMVQLKSIFRSFALIASNGKNFGKPTLVVGGVSVGVRTLAPICG